MDSAHAAIAGLAIIVAGFFIAQARQALNSTTLLASWRWAVASVLLWFAALLHSTLVTEPTGIQDVFWYVVALVNLCPLISVLGARRPGASAWTWFVILPMLAALGWPLLTLFGSDLKPGSFQLELPQLIGFALVLIMGAGNYIGTRHGISACCHALALCLIVAPVSTLTISSLSSQLSRTLGSLLLGAACMLPAVLPSRDDALPPLDRIWDDFQNLFGIVWGRRLQERINGVALQQGIPVELTPFEIRWKDSGSDGTRQGAELQLEQVMRWHLRRFVDPEWIDERMGVPQGTSE